jgi:hypothetical protein
MAILVRNPPRGTELQKSIPIKQELRATFEFGFQETLVFDSFDINFFHQLRRV